MAQAPGPSLDDESLSIFRTPEGAPRTAAAAPRRRFAFVRSLRRHWLLALLTFAATAGGSIALVVLLRRPVYSAEATILVSQVFAKNLSEDREFQLPRFSEFVKQQLVTVSREEIAMDALERLGDRRSLWMRPGESRRDAAARLSSAVLARQVPETSYLTVALEGPAPEGLAEVVNAVTDAYLARARGQPFYGMDLRLEALNRHKSQLGDEIRSRTELLARWAKEHGLASFDIKPGEGPVQESERALQAARSRRVETEARAAALESRHQLLRGVDLAVEARDLLVSDPELMGLKSALLQKKNEHRAKLTGLTPEHEGRKATEKLIAEIEAEIEKAEKAAQERIQGVLSQRREARLKDEKQTLAGELEQARQYEKTLADEAAAAARKTQRFNDVYFDAQNVQQEVDRLRRQAAAIEDRIDMMRLESYAPGFIHLVAPAMPPSGPLPARTARWAVLLGALAFLAALALPSLVDALDPRVRAPADLVQELEGCALVGVPEREAGSEPFIRDQLRRLALGLDRERKQKNRRRIVFTAVKSAAGTTDLVLDLTRELRFLGTHAIALEANALKPDPRFAAPDGETGLMSVLTQKKSLKQVIQPSDRGVPLRVPVGATGGRNILVGVNYLPSVLEELGVHADLVLIDAPPVLLSSDAEMLAGMADAVVLVVGGRATSIAEVKRAHRILRQVGPPILQTVVCRVLLSEGGRGRDYAELIKEYNVVARAPSA
jgi:uncharacterized protein involved in exopolysaccharide biosynthesis